MITSVSGQAAEVRVMSRTTLVPSSRCTSYTRPRSTTLIPSSGSTTSFIASVTSSTRHGAAGAGAPPAGPRAGRHGRQRGRRSMAHSLLSSIVCSTRPAGCRVLPRHPGQQRALHARGELRDAGERDPVLQHLLVGLHVALALHQGQELLVDRHRLVDRLADHEVGHHRGRRLRDRAAHGVVGDVLRPGRRPGGRAGSPRRRRWGSRGAPRPRRGRGGPCGGGACSGPG